MNAVRVETTIQVDGELCLTDLPYRRGDKVEAIVLGLAETHAAPPDDEREKERAEAIARFLDRTRASTFRSVGPYPTRDELHERG